MTAQEVLCAFCGAGTPLPADLLAVRMQQNQRAMVMQQQAAVQAEIGTTVRRTTSFVMWIVIVSVALPIVITVVVMVFVASVAHRAVPQVTPHGSHAH